MQTIALRLAAALAVSACTLPAAAQTPPGAATPAVQPITAPVTLNFASVPRFRFAIEAANLGMPLPSSPMRTIAEGSGRAIAAGTKGVWNLSYDRLTLDGTPIAGAGPLARAEVFVDLTAPQRFSYRADYQGIRAAPGGNNTGIQMILGQIVEMTAFSLFVPPQGPVMERTPVTDLNGAMNRFLSQSRLGAQLVQAATAAMPTGTLDYYGRNAVMLRQSGPLAVRIMNIDLPLLSEAMGIVDLNSGLPLLVRGQLTGQARLPFLNGAVNYQIRLATAVDGMPDPIAALQPLTPPPGQVLAPAAAAPPPAPVAAPAVAPPPRPAPPPAAAPAAAPAPRPAPPPPAPAGLTGLQQQRLQSLKGLLDQGLITREQHDQRQRDILSGQ